VRSPLLKRAPFPCTSKKSPVPPKFMFLPLFNNLWEWVKVVTDAVNFIYCVNVPAPPKTRYYTFLFHILSVLHHFHSCFFSPSFSVLHSLCSGPSHSCFFSPSFSAGPSCLRSFILSVVVPRRGCLYCMTLIYVFLSNSDLFILFEYAFDYCFVYSVTLSMHYCDYYCDWRLISSSE